MSKTEEKKRYALHQNDPHNQPYRNFLNRLLIPMMDYLDSSWDGLDFGCGPTPAISILLKERNIKCASYDPYFFNDPDLLKIKYDFITCSEVVEHFYEPKKSFDLMVGLLKPAGWLGVMTQRPPDDFLNWPYQRDPTHVCFYSTETFAWIAKKYSFEWLKVNDEVSLFKKRKSAKT